MPLNQPSTSASRPEASGANSDLQELCEAVADARPKYWASVQKLVSADAVDLANALNKVRTLWQELPPDDLKTEGIDTAAADQEFLGAIVGLSKRIDVLRQRLSSTANGSAAVLQQMLTTLESTRDILATLAKSKADSKWIKDALTIKEELFVLEEASLRSAQEILEHASIVIPVTAPPVSNDGEPKPHRGRPRKIRENTKNLIPSELQELQKEEREGIRARQLLAHLLRTRPALEAFLQANMEEIRDSLTENGLGDKPIESLPTLIHQMTAALRREHKARSNIQKNRPLPADDKYLDDVILAGVIERYLAENCDDPEINELIKTIERGDDAVFELDLRQAYSSRREKKARKEIPEEATESAEAIPQTENGAAHEN